MRYMGLSLDVLENGGNGRVTLRRKVVSSELAQLFSEWFMVSFGRLDILA
ncbi:hypothetical protein [Peribacillus frigoritolerans]